MKCRDCVYCYQNESDLFPRCHYDMPEDFIPCKDDDDDNEYEDPYDDDSYAYDYYDYYDGI